MKPEALYSFLRSLIIVIPLAIGLIRFNKIDKSYQPFIIYLIVGFITEVSTFVFFVLPHKVNAPLSNVYVLIEWWMITWQFYSWNFFKDFKTGFFLIIIIVTGVWITENVIYAKFATDYSPYYRILYSFILVLMSTNIINYTIIHEHKNIFRNSRFLLCISFIVVFIYKLIYEWAFQYSLLEASSTSRTTVNDAFGYVNAFQKLLCVAAALLIPERKEFNIENKIRSQNFQPAPLKNEQ